MTVPCQLTNAEMAEALRMNLTARHWTKALFGNLRVLIYLFLLISLVVVKMTQGKAVDWKAVEVMSGLLVLALVLFGVRLYRGIRKNAKQLNEACKQMTVDGEGITVEGTNGTKTFVPWSALNRWKEGKLVFTVGDGKTLRTFSKSALGEMQAGELRSLLMANVR